MFSPVITLEIAHDHHRELIRQAAAQRRQHLAQVVQANRIVRFYRHLLLALGIALRPL
jgi:hypothetical protein